MIPQEQIRELALAAADAYDLAASGQYLRGYLRLLTGLERAETAREGGAVWGPELVLLYQEVVERYRKQYNPPEGDDQESG
jgi:hypothetical protein